MKMPAALGRSGGGGGIGGVFLQHGEKLGFLVFALLGGWLMWSGISSLLTKRPTSDMLPAAIKTQADQAEQHVRQSTPLPEDKKTSGDLGKVTGQMAAWSKPSVAPPISFVSSIRARIIRRGSEICGSKKVSRNRMALPNVLKNAVPNPQNTSTPAVTIMPATNSGLNAN